VAHLGQAHHPRVWEGIVRALSAPAARAEALGPLREAYRAETAPERRWLLANALGAMASFVEVGDLDGIAEHRSLFRRVPPKPPHVAPAI
jgi:hypothetical protein